MVELLGNMGNIMVDDIYRILSIILDEDFNPHWKFFELFFENNPKFVINSESDMAGISDRAFNLTTGWPQEFELFFRVGTKRGGIMFKEFYDIFGGIMRFVLDSEQEKGIIVYQEIADWINRING